MALAPLLTAFLATFAASAMFTPMVRLFAQRTGHYAQPTDDRWHRKPVALFGGVAIAAAFTLGVAVFGQPRALVPLLACALLMFALGFGDDVFQMKATTKLVGQMLVAAVLIYLAPPVQITGWTIVDVLLAFVWVVGITNAFNLLDNMDGLSAGVAVIAGACYLVVLAPAGASPMAVAIAIFVGAVLGFLIFNVQPASIFMGDGGSLFLGAFLAAVSLLAAPGLKPRLAPVAAMPVLILLIPIFDTAFVTLARPLAGRSALVGGRDHTSHRLVALGVNERLTVLALWGLAAAGGLIAVSLQHIAFAYAAILVGLCLVLVAGLAVVLGHVRTEGAGRQEAVHDAPLVSELTRQHRVYEVLLDLALVAISYYSAFRIRFQEPGFTHFLPFFANSVPIVVGCQLAGLWAVGKYRQVWPSFGAAELMTILKGLALGTAASIIFVLYVYRFEGFSRAVFLTDGVILSFLLVGSRLVITSVDQYLRRQRADGRQVLIYGAGRGGLLLVRELLQNHDLALAPLGFIDDDPAKRRLRLEGLPVLGSTLELEEVLERLSPVEVLISVRDLSPERLGAIAGACAARGIGVRRMRLVLEEIGRPPSTIGLVHRGR